MVAGKTADVTRDCAVIRSFVPSTCHLQTFNCYFSFSIIFTQAETTIDRLMYNNANSYIFCQLFTIFLVSYNRMNLAVIGP